MKRESLDMYDDRPREMTAYLRNYGWHFNKKLCEFAISKMKRLNPSTGKKERIEPLTRDIVDEILSKYNIKLNNNIFTIMCMLHTNGA